jgi:alpha-1,2-mannosyltransferase
MGELPARRQAEAMHSAVASPAAPVIGSATATRRALRERRARFIAYACVLAEVGLVVGFAIAYRPFDLSIYLWGGHSVTEGLRLYLVQPRANWFTYPPFAAAVFTPLAALPAVVVDVAWELASIAAFAWSCVLALRLAGYRPSGPVLAAVVGAGFLLEPVYHTLYLGQVNLFLLALVMTDIWRAARGRTAGIGVGLAAAIKLTPAIFIALFLLTRRTRDAVIAAGTFAGCALAGYLVDPSASRLYWTRLFYDTARVNATYISNQSPYAAVARIMGGVGHVGSWYLAIPLILGGLGLAVAATLARRQDWLGAAAVTGTTSLLVSPISWTHHWVWIMPALVVLLRGGTASRITAACGYLLFALAPMWWTPWTFKTVQYGFHGLVTLTANCFLIAGVGFLAYMAVCAWRPDSRWRHDQTPDAAGSLSVPGLANSPGVPGDFRRRPRVSRVMTCLSRAG